MKKLTEWKKMLDATHPNLDNRCRGLDNHEKPTKIWSDPYGWVGELRECDAEFLVEAQNKMVPRLIEALELAIKQRDVCAHQSYKDDLIAYKSIETLNEEIEDILDGGNNEQG